MEFVIQQVVDVATEGLRLFANDVALLQLVAFLGTADVADDKENNNEQSENAVQKDEEGVVSDYFVVKPFILVPKIVRFHASDISAAEEIFKTHNEVVATKEHHIEHKGSLEKQINDTANDLSAEKMAQSHNKVRGLCQSATVPKVLSKLLKSAPDADKKANDGLKNANKKACDALSEIFKKL